MKLFSWNVNGLRAIDSKCALKLFIDDYSPDVLCMQEIKISEDQIETEGFGGKFSGYRQYYSFADKKGYSGTAIWSKNEAISVQEKFSDEIIQKFNLVDKFGDASKEGRLLLLEFADFYLINSYSPNTKRDLERLELKRNWDAALMEYIGELQKKKPVVICGDLNIAHREIDLANPKSNQNNAGFTAEERADFDNFMSRGLIDTFRHLHPDKKDAYTWWTWRANARVRNIGWRIDYFLVSPGLVGEIAEASIHQDVIGSDHCPVSLTLV
jgi:exodeoxyribonuclease III